MKCGECLMRDAKMVDLVGGVCPVCKADYRQEFDVWTQAGSATPKIIKCSAGSQAEAEELIRRDGYMVLPQG